MKRTQCSPAHVLWPALALWLGIVAQVPAMEASYRQLLANVTQWSEPDQQAFAQLALERLSAVFGHEVARVGGSGRDGAWRRGVGGYQARIIRLAGRAGSGAPVKFVRETHGEVRVIVGGEQLMLSAPSPAAQTRYEAALAREWCERRDCTPLIAQEHETPPEYVIVPRTPAQSAPAGVAAPPGMAAATPPSVAAAAAVLPPGLRVVEPVSPPAEDTVVSNEPVPAIAALTPSGPPVAPQPPAQDTPRDSPLASVPPAADSRALTTLLPAPPPVSGPLGTQANALPAGDSPLPATPQPLPPLPASRPLVRLMPPAGSAQPLTAGRGGRSGEWSFGDGAPPVYAAADGLQCAFADTRHLLLKQTACRALMSELRSLADGLRGVIEHGGAIDWARLTLVVQGAEHPGRVVYASGGQGFELSAPLLAAAPGLVQDAVPWLQLRLRGGLTTCQLVTPDALVYLAPQTDSIAEPRTLP